MTVNQDILDAVIRHAIRIERWKRGEATRVANFIEREIEPDLIRKLERLRISSRGQAALRLKALQEFYASAGDLIRKRISELAKSSRSNLGALAVTEAEWTVKVFNDLVPISVDFVTPNSSLLRGIVTKRPFQGRLLREWYSGLSQGMRTGVRSQVNLGIVQGESIPLITQRLRNVTNTTKRNAETIVRTATTHVTTQANEETYKENDIVKGVKYIATLDSRTTLICASLDGQVFPVDDGPRPPQHHQCRSRTTPVLKSFKELGLDVKDLPPAERASMNGAVPGDITFGQWLKGQPASVQNEVLGKSRADLFRSGKVSIDRFVDKTGRTLTLDELRKREGL